MSVPAEWRTLDWNERDVILSLALDGPGKRLEIFDRVGGVDGHNTGMETHRSLERLIEKGLVDKRGEAHEGFVYDLTDSGSALADRFRAVVC